MWYTPAACGAVTARTSAAARSVTWTICSGRAGPFGTGITLHAVGAWTCGRKAAEIDEAARRRHGIVSCQQHGAGTVDIHPLVLGFPSGVRERRQVHDHSRVATPCRERGSVGQRTVNDIDAEPFEP